MKERVAAVVAAVKGSHPMRTYDRYTSVRGNVLAGGIAYFAFFSLFPALAVGLSILGTLLRGRDELIERIVEGVNSYVPGLLHPGSASGVDQPGIYVQDWLSSDVLGVVASVGVVTLLVSGLGWMDALRQSVRAVFGDEDAGGNIVVVKIYDLGVLIVIGLGVVVSVLSVVASVAATDFLLAQVDLDHSAVSYVLLRGLGIVVPLVVDTAMFVAVFRLMPGADVPLRDLLSGAVVGGVGLGILKQVGTLVASRSAENPFLKAAAGIVVILILMNLIGRLVLFAAAWAAEHAEDRGTLHPHAAAEDGAEAEPERVFAGAHRTPRPRRGLLADPVTYAGALFLGALGTGAALAARKATGARVLLRRRR
ncbi:YihY/virulence factor BrkB family protein [Kineococcus xinjiangensis]|uniref:YihY/virulence factor BrkB family protein n=1 Tax=Kineococcus xinjiangensis TaxID=512762 RepID=UPI001FE5E9DB|nr:YihY/virulence factor BrkB family protein [Kineococcus xinjiangensis]